MAPALRKDRWPLLCEVCHRLVYEEDRYLLYISKVTVDQWGVVGHEEPATETDLYRVVCDACVDMPES